MTNELYKLIVDMCSCESCKNGKPCERVDRVFEALKASPLADVTYDNLRTVQA